MLNCHILAASIVWNLDSSFIVSFLGILQFIFLGVNMYYVVICLLS